MAKIKMILFFLLVLLNGMTALFGQTKIYEINAAVPPLKIDSGNLKLGGTDPQGNKIQVNSYYISINGIPTIPITGEFHFSRYPKAYWDESIKKMKAGGINVIATYVFWNIHEEKENVFDWSGDKDVRHFIELCAKNNLKVIVRIGPFCHGEIRSGGIPDWILGKPLTIRSNDPLYLSYVEKLYNETGKQLSGLYFKDGGPIIGIQIENEYQHSAAPWGLTYPGQPYDFTAAERDLSRTQQGVGVAEGNNPYATLGNEHMKVLKSLAVKAGMDVPLYTATGWGNAAVIPGECIPVTSAYAYPFWTEKKDLSPFFIYKDMHKNPDYAPVRYKPEDYPVFAAELGSGIMSVYTRRPIAAHKSFDAMINRCLGSGANGIGYYMYHGGSTPKGSSYFFSDEAYGLPKITYDFQAPIGEYGQVREGFHRLKLLHFFLNDFSDLLAPLQTILPANAASLKPDNLTDLRYALRAKGNSGFLFIDNFQDDTVTTDKMDIQVKIKTAKGNIMIPEVGGFNIKGDENAIFPFNFDLNGAALNYATAQLLAKGGEVQNAYYVFMVPEGVSPEFSFERKGTKIISNIQCQWDENKDRLLVKCNAKTAAEFILKAGNKKTTVLVISKSFALKSYVTSINGNRYLMFSDAVVLQNGNTFDLLSTGENNYEVSLFPKLNSSVKASSGMIKEFSGEDKIFTRYHITQPEVKHVVLTKQIGEKKLLINLPPSPAQGVNDVFLTIDYTGDTGMGFINGELVTDEFYKGIPWQIGLKKFLQKDKTGEMLFYFRPLYKNASYLIDLPASAIPDFGNANTFLKINNLSLTTQYKTTISFGNQPL